MGSCQILKLPTEKREKFTKAYKVFKCCHIFWKFCPEALFFEVFAAFTLAVKSVCFNSL